MARTRKVLARAATSTNNPTWPRPARTGPGASGPPLDQQNLRNDQTKEEAEENPDPETNPTTALDRANSDLNSGTNRAKPHPSGSVTDRCRRKTTGSREGSLISHARLPHPRGKTHARAGRFRPRLPPLPLQQVNP